MLWVVHGVCDMHPINMVQADVPIIESVCLAPLQLTRLSDGHECTIV
jgi:hypothetical protein